MKRNLIHERVNIIPITPTQTPSLSPTPLSPINKKVEKEYSLKENIFDPSKSSPPNEFMNKLQIRMKNYNSFSSLVNEDNREIE